LWGPFVLVDAILTPTREPSLLSSQVQQGPGHPPLRFGKAFGGFSEGDAGLFFGAKHQAF